MAKLKLIIEEATPDEMSRIANILNVTTDEIAPGVTITADEREALTDTENSNDAGAPSLPSDEQDKQLDVELAKSSTGQMIPWDERIHASTKKINADGSWKLVRGIGKKPGELQQVEAELLQTMQTPAAPAATQNNNDAGVLPPPPPPPPGDNVGTETITFAKALPLIQNATSKGVITKEQVEDECKKLGVTNFGLMAMNLDKLPDLLTALRLV